jgi:hypothetical protein
MAAKLSDLVTGFKSEVSCPELTHQENMVVEIQSRLHNPGMPATIRRRIFHLPLYYLSYLPRSTILIQKLAVPKLAILRKQKLH